MPKVKDVDPKKTTYVALSESNLLFIETMFAGNNFSQRLNSALDKLKEFVGDLRNRPDAIVAYRQTEDEREWGKIPFECNKKNWQNIVPAAIVSGYVYQVVEVPEKNEVTVYVAPRPKKECPVCLKIKTLLRE